MGSKSIYLEKELIARIQEHAGTGANTRFMSERTICQQFDVSRTTVRRVIANLCKQGYLVQIHGKGTFLKSNAHSIFSVTRCSQNYGELGFLSNWEILLKQVVSATSQVAKNLEISVGEPVMYLLIRYCGNRMIFNVTESYLPLSRFPNIETVELQQTPILALLKAQYGAHATQTENLVDAILPPAFIAERLEIDRDTPIMLFESVTSGAMGETVVPFEYFKCYYKTDHFRFSFKQQHGVY